jgi:hypothetical protein
MATTHGYIYVRLNDSYYGHDVCLLGKTENIPEKDAQYATSEFHRGQFIVVFEVPSMWMNIIERRIVIAVNDMNKHYDGGVDFYRKDIIARIEPLLILWNIQYRKLTHQEISDMIKAYSIMINNR